VTSFVDTNVLVYAHDQQDPNRALVAIKLLTELWTDGTGAVSTQVLQEFYNVATRKFRPPMSPEEAREVVADYAEWPIIETTPQLIVSASILHERHDISFWDAMIVEAAQLAGATELLTEDLQHGTRFGEVTVRNPFVSLDE
jgi:predicted nucleic acid-binding protein